MARFFIDRPIFAWVIAIIIMLAGGLSITQLPVSMYPTIAPPSVSISAFYPGATAEAVENAVTQVIEQNMKGLDGLIYMTATSQSSGSAQVQITFGTGIRENGLLVPQQGVQRDPKGGTTAMVVGEDGNVAVREVRVSQTVGDKWLVEDGLAAGDRVIVEGLQKIRPGAAVQATEAGTESPPAVASARR